MESLQIYRLFSNWKCGPKIVPAEIEDTFYLIASQTDTWKMIQLLKYNFFCTNHDNESIVGSICTHFRPVILCHRKEIICLIFATASILKSSLLTIGLLFSVSGSSKCVGFIKHSTNVTYTD